MTIGATVWGMLVGEVCGGRLGLAGASVGASCTVGVPTGVSSTVGDAVGAVGACAGADVDKVRKGKRGAGAGREDTGIHVVRTCVVVHAFLTPTAPRAAVGRRFSTG